MQGNFLDLMGLFEPLLKVKLKDALIRENQSRTDDAQARTAGPNSPHLLAAQQASALEPSDQIATFGAPSPGGVGMSGGVMTPWHPGMPLAAGTQLAATGVVPRGYSAPQGPANVGGGGGGGGRGDGESESGLESIEKDMLGGKAAEKAKRDLEHSGDVGPKPLGEYIW
jgi:hypothetical protein